MSSYGPYGGQYPPPGDPYGGPPAGPPPGSYPPPPPQPYAGYAPPPVGPRNGFGIAALILGVLGLLFCWTIAGGIVLGVVAIILGALGRGRVKRGEATNSGLAISGIMLGALAIVLGLVFIPIWISFFSSLGFGDYVDCMQKAGNDTTAQLQCENDMRDKIVNDYGVTVTPTP